MAGPLPGQGPAEILEAELARLENSLHHLHRSNRELREALVEEPGERVYEEAVEENERVIGRMEGRAADLRAALLEARQQQQGRAPAGAAMDTD